MANTVYNWEDRYKGKPKLWQQDCQKVKGLLATMKQLSERNIIGDATPYTKNYLNPFKTGVGDNDLYDRLPEDESKKSMINACLSILSGVEKQKSLEAFLMEPSPVGGKTNYRAIVDELRETGGEDAVREFDDQLSAMEDIYDIRLDVDKVREASGVEPPGRVEEQKPVNDEHHVRRNLEQDANREQSALEWTEEFKAKLKSGGARHEADYPERYFAEYMAARSLSESVRGDKSTLNKTISAKDISDEADRLMQSDAFKTFQMRMRDGRFLSKLEAAALKSPGHGGGIDDLYTEHIASAPAGTFENLREYKRHMPTVKQRIEALKEQAKKGSNEEKAAAAAEIVVLRNLCHAERNKKATLDKRIPTDGSIREGVQALLNDPNTKKALLSPAVQGALEGRNHGGQMVENLRAACKRAEKLDEQRERMQILDDKPFEKSAFSKESEEVLFANTVGAQAAKVKQELKTLLLEDTRPGTSLETVDDVKRVISKSPYKREAGLQLLGKYMALCAAGNEGKEMDKDMPWRDYEKTIERPDNRNLIKQLTNDGKDLDNTAKLFNSVAAYGPNSFMRDVRQVHQKVQQQKSPLSVEQDEPQKGGGVEL